ncbi:MAG: M3 family metallopeptidase [Myxococcales bacterium FL481]|nr:MAG: M3 family metallopeptidase [Myxococcales bacterium FL481]
MLTRRLVPIAALGLVAACATPPVTDSTETPATAPAQADPPALPANALLESWAGPYGGVPAFDRMQLDALEPAMDAAMAYHLTEIDAIAENPDPATFDNTIVALERAGEPLHRAFVYYGIWRANLSTPEFREIQGRLAPKLSAFESKIIQNAALFARVKAVYEGPELSTRTPAEQRLAWLTYNDFAHHGATLSGEQKARYAAIELRLAELHTKFGNNVLVDEEKYVLFLDQTQLDGLPDTIKAAAAAAAKERGQPGKFAITNTRSSMDPFLTYSTRRDLREQVWRTYYSRGDNGDASDNNAVIAEMLALRHERVQLLGYANYAAWRLEDRMAKTPERAMALMEAVWPAAVARAKQEVADMQQVANAEGHNLTIEPWDYRFYADKVRRAKYALDSNEVKQYLQLDKLREAMFMVAGRLFNFGFSELPQGTVPVFHADVRVWEVTDLTSGAHVGLWYLDPFARAGKRSGAWATSYRGHTTFNGKKTVLSSNNSNFIKGAPGEPVLLSWDDARTYFHEFGHALHALSSTVAYPSLNGGVRDYVEFQSQLLERWLLTDEVINGFLVHHQTGQPMPAELVEKIKRAATFNQGFATVEYLASALMDLKFHTVDPTGLDPDAFERETLTSLGMPREIVMRHRSPHFAHIFSSEGYAAAYYGYMWADVLTADAAEAFAEAPGGFYDRDVAQRLVKHLFAPRNAVDPGEAYRAFRGRDADIKALMRDRGFLSP